jgi:tetratricopeptide (TPR) repeat protein
MLFRDAEFFEHKFLVRILVSVIIAYIGIAFFSFPKERVIHQTFLYVSFGILLALYFKDKQKHTLNKNGLILMAAILTPILILSLERTKGEMLSKNLMIDRASNNWKSILTQVENNEQLFFYTMDPVSMPIPFYEGLAQLSLDDSEASLIAFEKALKIHPNNIHVINNLASLYQLEGDYARSIEYYSQAMRIAPFYQAGALNLCGAYFNEGKVEKAYEVLLTRRDLFEESNTVYNSYLITVLRTLYLNLLDEQTTPLKYKREVSDEWLLNCFNESYTSKKKITEIMLSKSIHIEY